MIVEIKDILLKAAEDVQQGMWCQGDWFRKAATSTVAYTDIDFFSGKLGLEKAASYLRCAEGSIALATRLLGGNTDDYMEAVVTVGHALPVCGCHNSALNLAHFNDDHLSDADHFVSGQRLAELFRTTAEAL